MELVEYRVGERFPREDIIDSFYGKDGGASLNYKSDEKSLCLYVGISSPTSFEKSSFRKGLIEFALYESLDIDTSLILLKFGEGLILDLLYDINLLDNDVDGVVEANAFNMYFIDTSNGILEGIRTIGLGSNFMNEINKITINDRRYTSEQYSKFIDTTYKFDLNELWDYSKKIEWNK